MLLPGELRTYAATNLRVIVAVAVLAASLAVVALSATPAAAAAQITLDKSATATVLVDGELQVALTASNPADEIEFNVSFRDELAPGVTYVAGSTSPTSIGDPQVVTTADGQQVLLWPDVADLRPGDDTSISFRVAVDPDEYPVGATVNNTGRTYAHTDPSTVPDFDSAGGPVPGTFTESASSNTTTTQVTAFDVTKQSSGTPEGELLRGVHEHPSTYTLTVTNSDGAATDGVVLVDFLPAGLEYLGCGDVDNTPGGAVEYPGSGRLDQIPDVGADCLEPATVNTVLDPPTVESGGVFTRLTWTLGTLAPGENVTVRYVAGIPQRANTMDFPSGRPTPASLGQAANLDNNIGASTRETGTEQQLTNHAGVVGSYQGEVVDGTPAVLSSSVQHTVSAEDLSLQKSVTPTTFEAGGIATYTLTIRASEYINASDVVVTDALPRGLCPLDPTTNYDADDDPECGPRGDAPTGADYDSVVANSDGSFTVTFTDVALEHDGTATITYQAAMRSAYPDGEPSAAGDSFTNHASLTGTTRPRAVVQPEGGPTQVEDESEATITSQRPGLTKLIQPDADPMSCSGSAADYLDPDSSPAADVTFGEGDRVCFLVRATFPDTVQTKDVVISDVLPAGTTYEPGSAEVMPDNTATLTLADESPLTWQVGDPGPGGRFVEAGDVFEVRFSLLVTEPGPGPDPETRINRVKLGGENTEGDLGSTRADVSFDVAAPPPVSLDKAASRVTAPAGPLADGAVVASDDVVEYTLTVGNDGAAPSGTDREVVGPDVWDLLPAGITCADVSEVEAPGSCTDPGDAGHPTFDGDDTLSAIRWDLPDTTVIAPGDAIDLTYSMTVPDEASVALSYTNTGAAASYGSATNTGSVAQHHPADNVDTTTGPEEIDAPAASDDFTVVTQSLGLTKSTLTAVGEQNNSRTPADLLDTEDTVIGEQVTYTLTATVPAHSAVYGGQVVDTPPPGVEVLSASASPDPLPAGFDLDPATGALTFPDVYVNDDDTDDVFVVTLQAGVTDDAANTQGTVRTNSADFTSLRGPGGERTGPTATAGTRVVEPGPTLTKEDDDANGTVAGNQLVTFTLAAGNAADRPPLHDAYVVDCVPDGITVVGSPGDPVPPDLPATCDAGETLLFWDLGEVDPGEAVTLTYGGTIDPDVVALETLTNTATLAGSSLADGSLPVQDGERGYTTTASDTLTVAPAEVDKAVDQPTATIGERRTYTVTLTVPADVNFYDAMIRDLLPAGLDPDSVELEGASCVPCVVDAELLDPAPGPDGGTYIAAGFGDVLSAPVVRILTVEYSAVVADVAANTAGTDVVNAAQAQWNTTTNQPDPEDAGVALESRSNTATATVLVTEPSLTVEKSVSDETPSPGEVFSYSVVISNETGSQRSDAYDITVVDTVPNGIIVDPATITEGGVLTGATAGGGGTITWTLAGPVAPGASTTLGYDARLSSPPPDGPRTNTVAITRYFSLDDDVASNAGNRQYAGPEDSATVSPAVPHVTVTKDVVGGDLAYLDESKPWRIGVVSDGDTTAQDVTVTDVLPPGWTYDPGSAQVTVDGVPVPAPGSEPDVSTSGGVETLTWTALADLPVGAELEILFTATPGDDTLTDPGVGHTVDHVNTASVTAQDDEGSTGPPSAPYHSGPAETVAHIDSADVVVTKTHEGDAVAGEPFAWTVEVSNDGPDPAVGPFSVTDTFPPGLVGPAGSGPGWDCSTGSTTITCTRADADEVLPAGSAFPPISISGAVPPGAEAGMVVVNRVSVSDRTYDPDLTNNDAEDATTLVAEADLELVKALTTDLVAGENASYTLDPANNGPSVHRGTITVSDTVPEGTTFVSQTGTGWTFTRAGDVLTWTRIDPAPLGPLPQITVTVAVDESRTTAVTNTAEITGTLPDHVPGNNVDSTTDVPDVLADLLLEKRHTGGSFTAGETGSYRFTVLNAGPSTAAATVTITDTLPAGLSFASFDSVVGTWDCFADGQDLTCELAGPLDAGTVAAVDVVVDIDPAYPGGPVHNEARVDSPTTDPVPGNNVDDDDTDIDAVADLALTKSHTGDAVAGETFGYTLAVTNNGASDTVGPLTVSDLLPIGMTFDAGTTQGAGWTCAVPDPTRPRVVTCTYAGGLAVGATAPPLTLGATVAPDAGPATLVNRAVVDGPPDGADDNLLNNLAVDPTVVTDEVEVSVEKTVTGADPVRAGETTGFSISATNDGPSTADQVTVTDVVPDGMTLVSATGTGWECFGSTTVTCVLPELAPDATSEPIVLVVRVGSGVPDGTVITNTAEVATSTAGDTPAGNTDSADVAVDAVADLAIEKLHPGGTEVIAGETTRFTLSVTNNGPSDVPPPVRVVDDLPADMTYVDDDGGWDCSAVAVGDHERVTCTLPDTLLAGTSAPTLGLTVLVAANAEEGSATNTARVESDTEDSDDSNNEDSVEVEILRSADLAVTKTHTGTALVGEQLTFTVAVRNDGPSDTTGVGIVDELPQGLQYVSATGEGWTCGAEGAVVRCELAGTLAADTDAPPVSLTVDVLPAAYPGVVNGVTVSGDSPDTDPTDNADTDAVRIPPRVNLTLGKRHLGTPTVGERVRYVLDVRNEGPTPDPGPVTILDRLPRGLSFVSAGGPGWTCDGQHRLVRCERGILDVGQRSLVSVVAEVLPAAYPEIINTAVVRTEADETRLRDNAAADRAEVVPLVHLEIEKDVLDVSRSRATWEITVTNRGPNVTSEPVVVVDDLPPGLSYLGATGSGWDCSTVADTVTCTHPSPIDVGSSSTILLRTTVEPDAPAALTNVATVSGGGDRGEHSDAAETVVPVAPGAGAGPGAGASPGAAPTDVPAGAPPGNGVLGLPLPLLGLLLLAAGLGLIRLSRRHDHGH